MTRYQCKCGRASTSGECRDCQAHRVASEQDRRNKRARRERKVGKVSDALIFAGIRIDT